MTEPKYKKITHLTPPEAAAAILITQATVRTLHHDYPNVVCGFCTQTESHGQLRRGDVVYFRQGNSTSYVYSHKSCVDALLPKKEEPEQQTIDFTPGGVSVMSKLDLLLGRLNICLENQKQVFQQIEQTSKEVDALAKLEKGCHVRLEKIEKQLTLCESILVKFEN